MSQILLSMAVLAVVSFQWFFWGELRVLTDPTQHARADGMHSDYRIFARLLADRIQVHRKPGQLWIDERLGRPICRIYEDPCIALLRLPTHVRCHHVRTQASQPSPTGSTSELQVLVIFRPMLAVGATAERGRIGPVLVFVFIWATLVYDPVSCRPCAWLHSASTEGCIFFLPLCARLPAGRGHLMDGPSSYVCLLTPPTDSIPNTYGVVADGRS